MSTHGFGIERRAPGVPHSHASPARFLVLIVDATGVRVARLFDDRRRPVAEFDAGAQEVALMTQGLVGAHGADASDWDTALGGHSAAERRAAEVYTLDV